MQRRTDAPADAAVPARRSGPAGASWSRLPALLVDRLGVPSAYGVALTIGLAVLAAAAIAFAHLAEDVLHREGLTWLDGPVNAAVPRLRSPALTEVMTAMTLLASAPAIVA